MKPNSIHKKADPVIRVSFVIDCLIYGYSRNLATSVLKCDAISDTSWIP